MSKVLWWPMAKTDKGTILNTNTPVKGVKECINVIKMWDDKNGFYNLEEAWIDLTINDDPEPVKRIHLVRDWKIGKSIILKENTDADDFTQRIRGNSGRYDPSRVVREIKNES